VDGLSVSVRPPRLACAPTPPHAATLCCRAQDFLLDLAPTCTRTVVASPCSGHGFKFTSVVGEILADLALDGGSKLPIGAFSFDAMPRYLDGTVL